MTTFDTGTFIVDSNGEIEVDFLFDGGWFKGELAIFSLEGMDPDEAGTIEFVEEAARRALTNSSQGYVVTKDKQEGAKFSATLSWESNYNTDPEKYKGVKTFNMTPGDEVAFMLVQNTSVQATLDNPENTSKWGKNPIFSIPEANLFGSEANQFEFVDINGTGTIGLEDVKVSRGDRDYNDMVLQIVGMEGNLASLEDHINPTKDWRNTEIGQQLIEYSTSRVFSEGVFEVGETGEIIIDFLFDGGRFQGEVGIFSLEDLNPEEMGSQAFTQEAISRSQSNSLQGHVVVQDAIEGAKYNSTFNWESDHNQGDYQGKETFLMNPGDTFGMILIPNGTFDEAILTPDSTHPKAPIFSMSEANTNDQIQFADIKTSPKGTIVGFEDVHLDRQSNEDYNDIIIAIEGIQKQIGISAIEDVIFPSRNWLGAEVSDRDILPYFSNLGP